MICATKITQYPKFKL